MRCCVPSCRNTGDNVCSSEGRDEEISFHSFPSEEYLRVAWLRALGKQDTPLPDSAVVCSQHFLSYDISESESGLRQIVPGAVPSTVLITMQHIKQRNKNLLKSRLVTTTLGPDHCDLHIVEGLNADKQTESNKTAHREYTIVETEGSDSVLMDEHIEVKQEYKPCIDDEFVESQTQESDESKALESKHNVALREATYREQASTSSASVEQVSKTLHAQEYNAHMSNHHQNSDGGGKCATSQVLSHHPREMASEALLTTEETDIILKIEPALDEGYSNYEADTNTITYVNCEIELIDICKELEKTQEIISSDTASEFHCQATRKHKELKISTDSSHYILPTNAAMNRLHKLTCNVCGKVFKKKRLLLDHINTHYNTKIFTCDLCQYKATRKYRLGEHMRTHTGTKNQFCTICDYKCVSRFSLVRHMRTHTGEKPFPCELCDYKCAQNSDLVKHMRTHTGEKSHACKICDYKCSASSSLAVHMRTHTGDKPHCCTLCNYRGSKSFSLKQHMKRHAKKTR